MTSVCYLALNASGEGLTRSRFLLTATNWNEDDTQKNHAKIRKILLAHVKDTDLFSEWLNRKPKVTIESGFDSSEGDNHFLKSTLFDVLELRGVRDVDQVLRQLRGIKGLEVTPVDKLLTSRYHGTVSYAKSGRTLEKISQGFFKKKTIQEQLYVVQKISRLMKEGFHPHPDDERFWASYINEVNELFDHFHNFFDERDPYLGSQETGARGLFETLYDEFLDSLEDSFPPYLTIDFLVHFAESQSMQFRLGLEPSRLPWMKQLYLNMLEDRELATEFPEIDTMGGEEILWQAITRLDPEWIKNQSLQFVAKTARELELKRISTETATVRLNDFLTFPAENILANIESFTEPSSAAQVSQALLFYWTMISDLQDLHLRELSWKACTRLLDFLASFASTDHLPAPTKEMLDKFQRGAALLDPSFVHSPSSACEAASDALAE